jgi:dienelactone hydrolase
MKKLAAILFLFSLVGKAQTFQTGTTTITFNDPSRTGGFGSGGGPGRQIQTEIYYPSSTTGSNVALASGSFPVIVFGHGFVMSWDSYSTIYSELSKRGYIIALPRTEGGTSPNHNEFGKDLALIGNKILELNISNTLAPIFVGKVSQKLALAGHSMGGGCSFLAAQNNNSVTCVFNFAAAQTNPASSQAAKSVNVPVLIVGGEKDCVASPAVHQDKMWDSTGSPNKFEIIIKNLTHCDFSNGTNVNCNFGQNASGCPNSVSNATARQLFMNFVNPFVDALLKDDCTAAVKFTDSVNISQVIHAKKVAGSILCTNTSVTKNNLIPQYSLFPNPATEEISIISSEKFIKADIYSIEGKIIKHIILNEKQNKISVHELDPGCYFIVAETEDQKRSAQKFIRN